MKVKDLMIPVADYQTLGTDANLGDAAAIMTAGKHRDILIVDQKGAFVGVLTMTDIITALEPNYKKLSKKDLATDVLSKRFVAEQFKEFNLWADTLTNVCTRGVEISVMDAMHVPADSHYITEDSDLEHGLHMYMVGTPQPLIVRNGSQVTGVLRMADIFNELVKHMNACVLRD